MKFLHDNLALSAGEGAYPCQQLFRDKRLRHIVVGAAVQTGHLVAYVVSGGQHQHRRLDMGLSKLLYHIKSIFPG